MTSPGTYKIQVVLIPRKLSSKMTYRNVNPHLSKALGWICSPEWPGHALGQVHVVTGCSWRDGPMDNSLKVCPLEQDCQAHVHKPPSASASSPLSSVSV